MIYDIRLEFGTDVPMTFAEIVERLRRAYPEGAKIYDIRSFKIDEINEPRQPLQSYPTDFLEVETTQ